MVSQNRRIITRRCPKTRPDEEGIATQMVIRSRTQPDCLEETSRVKTSTTGTEAGRRRKPHASSWCLLLENVLGFP